MIRSMLWLRIITALTVLSMGARSFNSINVELESPGGTNLGVLGTPNLNRHNGTFDLSVRPNGKDGSCNYTLRFEFDVIAQDLLVGDPEFSGTCAPTDSTGTAPDGLQWHLPRRHWAKFPGYIYNTTGFDHISLDWLPCGRRPAGFRTARYDINLYTVTPEYRVYMVCEVFKTPAVCQYNQTSHLGRTQFTIPRLAKETQYLPNMPVRYRPDPKFPEAFEHEGLMHYDPKKTPRTTEDWILPTFLMSTHDASVVSWRAMIPHSFFHQKSSAQSKESQRYVYQTMMSLPSNWNTSFNGTRISVNIEGIAKMCGSAFDEAKGKAEEEGEEEAKKEQNYDLVSEYDLVLHDDLLFEDDSNSTDTDGSDMELGIMFEDGSNATETEESQTLIN